MASMAAREVVNGIGQSLRTPELKKGFERSPPLPAVYEQCRTD